MARIGDIVGDKYRLVRLLGQGGMGSVFAAEHVILGKVVAIKLLHAQYAANEDAVRRFYREAQAAAAVGHRGIAEVHDVGQMPDGSPYIVMELLRGESLSDLLERRGRLEPGAAVEVLCQVLAALQAVHDKGIIHRDLKPENVFVTRHEDGGLVVKLLDFGISKVTGRASTALTVTGLVMGTPHYMAPEQARGVKDLDARVDVWAAGAMLYRTLTGRLPIEGETYAEVVAHIIEEPILPPRAARPEIPEGLERVALRALAKDRAERIASAAEILAALAPFRPGLAAGRDVLGKTLLGEPIDDVATLAPGSLDARALAARQDAVATAAAPPPPPHGAAPAAGGTAATTTAAESLAAMPKTLVTPPAAVAAPSATPTAAPTSAYQDRTPPWSKGMKTPDTFTVAVGGPPATRQLGKGVLAAVAAGVAALLLGAGSLGAWLVVDARGSAGAAGSPPAAGAVPWTPSASPPTSGAPPSPAPLLATPAAGPLPQPILPPATGAAPVAAAPAAAAPAAEPVEPPVESPPTPPPALSGAAAAAPAGRQPPTKAALPSRERAAGESRVDGPPLSAREVALALAPAQPALQKCIGLANPAPTVVRVKVQVDGTGAGRYVTAAPAPPPAVAACLGRTIASTRFRATAEGGSFVIPVRRPEPPSGGGGATGDGLRPSPFGR